MNVYLELSFTAPTKMKIALVTRPGGGAIDQQVQRVKTDGQSTQRPLNSSSRALGAANSMYQLVCPEFHQREEANRDSSGWREIRPANLIGLV
ncbi:unnamed protein product [Prunus armeniaca]|uniref:Uncharacterized protein n=1 Tax=Prunus armeniaca TaxID=36596 RepID=A0A6J5VHA9_PRUAR|nr:unnamed protein product [Prunus armeniaca]